ncbi:MAG: toll/interleukin-1 receptor domain-containing protein [Alphaproteobacteria bacterium]|nr:toll/interleukin-1 receptor domain-containing protein [Alphaproteobacteria bacterium]
MTRKPAIRKSAAPASNEVELQVTEAALVRSRSLVFISHDTRDAALAELFANLLTDVSAGTLKSFRSSDKKGVSGIEFGSEWYGTIMSQLGSATDVVALLTPHSLDRPWILYEAGVAKGKLDTVVFGIALGVGLDKVSTGPFGQFQNCGDDEDSLTKLVMQLLARNPDASPREEAVRMQVQLFRTRVEENQATATIAPEKASEEENVAKLFEEVKAMVREMPDRLDSRLRSGSGSTPLRRIARRSPDIFEEILFTGRFRSSEIGCGPGWLMFVSLLREDFPWLHESGLEIYRLFKNGKDIAKASREFRELVEVTFHSPMVDYVMRDDKMLHSMYRHIPQMTEAYIRQMIDEQIEKRHRAKALP